MSRDNSLDPSKIGVAHQIATQIWDAGYRDTDGLMVLGMALGIYMEAHEGGHRELRPLSDGMLQSAQIAFDALRAARKGKPGNA